MGISRSSTGCARASRWLAIGRIRFSRWLVLRAACFAAGLLFLSAARLDQAPRAVRVRFEWRSEKPERWAGILETSQGTIAEPASLGVAGDEAGTLWADGNCLWLGRRGARDRDGFEVTVTASPRPIYHCGFNRRAQMGSATVRVPRFGPGRRV